MSNNKIEYLFRDNMGKKVKEIKEQYPDIKFYSYSRLGTFHQCKRSYYYTYVDKKPQRNNVYSILGEVCHKSLEDLYNGKVDELDRVPFETEFAKCQMFGIDFPASKYDIAGSYKADIENFYNIYKKKDGKEFISELGFIYILDSKHALMGYIDLLIYDKDTNSCEIIDFKTSSEFKKDHLLEKGRQLVLYKVAIEQLYGIKVNKVYWQMLKLVDVTVGTYKPKIKLKGKEWVSKCSLQITNLMKKKGYDDLEATLSVAKAVKANSIDGLPQDIKDEITVNIRDEVYEVTPELEEELINYIKDTIEQIENMGSDIEEWTPNVDKFYGTNLCGFGGCNGICQECNKGDE